jgi:peptidoglycan/xylan/chitin deacetylase (PgdA/CDA1 family)
MRRINSPITFGAVVLITVLSISGCYPLINGAARASDSVGNAEAAPGASPNSNSSAPAVSNSVTLPAASSTQTGAGETRNATSGDNQTVAVNSTEGPPPAPSSTNPQYPQKATEMLVPEVYHAAPGTVELTIDDGPSPYTESIIQTFAKYHDHTTFFFVGQNVERFPSAVRFAVQNGDGIGIHTMHHPEMTNLSKAQQQSEIEQTAAVIHQYDPNPLTLYRPPYGLWNNFTEEILQQDKLSLALWDADPRDWAAKSPTDVVNAVLNGHPSGKVFDLHDTELTLQALPAILQGLQKQHLQVVVMTAPTSVTGIAGTPNSIQPGSSTNTVEANNSIQSGNAANTVGTNNSIKPSNAANTVGANNSIKPSNAANTVGASKSIQPSDAANTVGANNSIKSGNAANTVGANNSIKSGNAANTVGATNTTDNSSQSGNRSDQTNNDAANTASN